MLYKSILNVVGVVAVLAVALTGCGDGDGDNSGGGGGGKGSDISKYRTKIIGTQTWMAENLDNAIAGSKCYGEGGKVIVSWGESDDDPPVTTTLSNAEVQDNCTKYGRLYTWDAAKQACPAGYHLPSDIEWMTLVDYAEYSAEKLKSTSGWNYVDGYDGNGTDDYEFSALPGGAGWSKGIFGVIFDNAGNFGSWWSATEIDAESAKTLDIGYHYVGMDKEGDDKTRLLSVRCVKD